MSAQEPPPLGLVRFVEVGAAGTIFLSSPLLSRGLPDGKRWMEIRPLLGQNTQTAVLGQGDPRQQLDMLRAVSDNTVIVGHERIRGVQTIHYRATLDNGKYAALLRARGGDQAAAVVEKISRLTGTAIPIEAWIDQHGLLRRVSIAMGFPIGTTGTVGTMQMTIDLFDFGVKPQVNLPPQGDVYDATSLAQGYLSQLGK